jgi:hypothetical protein
MDVRRVPHLRARLQLNLPSVHSMRSRHAPALPVRALAS